MSRHYQHPTGREVRGHNKECSYFKGDESLRVPCECDDEPIQGLTRSMLIAGWTSDERGPSGSTAFYRTFGDHLIFIARVIDGWQYHWTKGGTYTYYEERGFATIAHCLNHLWGTQAERMDQATTASWEHAAMFHQLKEAGIEPKTLKGK